MIDLHSHILPGLDDGARDMNAAFHMAALAVRSGVGTMVVTPHCLHGGAMEVRSALTRLRKTLHNFGIPLRLCEGMEIFGTPETAALLKAGKLLTLNRSRYPLIEFGFESDGTGETAVLEDLIRAGYTPLVAHPERYQYVQEDPEFINLWKKMGCAFQINRGSLLGRFGEGPRAMAWELAGRGFATAVASDAHAATFRTPWLGDVRELLLEALPPTAAAWLLEENPRRIINNEELPSGEPEWF